MNKNDKTKKIITLFYYIIVYNGFSTWVRVKRKRSVGKYVQSLENI